MIPRIHPIGRLVYNKSTWPGSNACAQVLRPTKGTDQAQAFAGSGQRRGARRCQSIVDDDLIAGVDGIQQIG